MNVDYMNILPLFLQVLLRSGDFKQSWWTASCVSVCGCPETDCRNWLHERVATVEKNSKIEIFQELVWLADWFWLDDHMTHQVMWHGDDFSVQSNLNQVQPIILVKTSRLMMITIIDCKCSPWEAQSLPFVLSFGDVSCWDLNKKTGGVTLG